LDLFELDMGFGDFGKDRASKFVNCSLKGLHIKK